jgi:hypothetical protein
MKSRIPRRDVLVSVGLLAFSLALCLVSSRAFSSMHRGDPVFPSRGLTAARRLSDYFPALRNGPGDTEVFIFQGTGSGGTLLITGGAHPNEPAGYVTAVLLAETIRVRKGRVILIPRANASGFTHNDPQEASPQRFFLQTEGGERCFRLGSRLTNPVHQWPDPTVYVNPAGQELSGNEIRNLNRCYPGREHGFLTERIAYGIVQLIRAEKVNLAIDVHESAPEYPVVNAIVFHENSADLAALAQLQLEAEGYDFRLEASPTNLRGLSHREWGDHARVKAVLLETPNASHGRLKGRPSASLIVDGKDRYYAAADRLGRLFVSYPDDGIPLSSRVARHLAAIRALLAALAETEPEQAVDIEEFPAAHAVAARGVGAFLHAPE